MLTKENVKDYRAHLIMEKLGCDLKTARKIKSGEIDLDDFKSTPKKNKETE